MGSVTSRQPLSPNSNQDSLKELCNHSGLKKWMEGQKFLHRAAILDFFFNVLVKSRAQRWVHDQSTRCVNLTTSAAQIAPCPMQKLCCKTSDHVWTLTSHWNSMPMPRESHHFLWLDVCQAKIKETSCFIGYFWELKQHFVKTRKAQKLKIKKNPGMKEQST